MAKTNRKTRKELEEIIVEIIQEVKFLRQGFTILDNYLGAYVKFNGHTLAFNDFLKTEIEKSQKESEAKTSKPEKGEKNDKKRRYEKISTPSL
jgi:hypothetical protein